MTEVQARSSASRGRGSGRGGRGGISRGGRQGGRSHGADSKTDGIDNPSAFDDENDTLIASLKKEHGDKVPVIKEMFVDWSEVDILFLLQETGGDEVDAITRIAEGTATKWDEVSKPKKKKDPAAPAPADLAASTGRPARGGRNVSEGARGRGRATERGARASTRGRSSAATTNGARTTAKESQPLSVPTEESSAWETSTGGAGWGDVKSTPAAAAPDAASAPIVEDPSKSAAASGGAKTWASMLRQSTAPKVVPKPVEAPVAQPAEQQPVDSLPSAEPESAPEPVEAPAAEAPAETTPAPAETETATTEVPRVIEPEVALPPSKDQLTETNLEQVHDDSHPPATATVASTAADSWDPRVAASATATPLSASHQQHQQGGRQQAQSASSGYAASALKATTERPTRTPSYQRRILDQEEAVRMPGNREVDRAAVQFGAFNLGGDEDVDGDREEPETRTQPPAESPVAHPRASLPPAVPQPAVPDVFASQKQAQPAAAPSNATPTTAAPAQPAAPSQAPTGPQAAQNQYSRYGQPGAQEPSAFPQKPVDPFSQQANPAQNLDSYQSQQGQGQQQSGGAYGSAPSDYYSSAFGADSAPRNPYNYYGQPYGQQPTGQQDGLAGQQRSYGGYGSQADNLSQYPQSGSAHSQSRYGAGGVTNDAHNSGHSTPNPTTQAQQQQPAAGSQASQQQQQQQQSHVQQGYGGYNHPYAGSPYYSNYMNYNAHYAQGGYGGPYGGGGKGGMYPYSMQGPYDHASSPASGFGQSSLHRDNSGLSSNIGSDFGRSGSTQSTNPGSLGGAGSGFDSFGRSGSSFPSQAGQGFNNSQPSASGPGNDDLKPFGESKAGSGPSPALGGGARPGSATQSTPASQGGLPPPQSGSQMGGYGGYPNHMQHGLHGNSGYGMGGSGQHGNAGFGSYGQGAYGSYYGSGGQGQQGQQQNQQQRGGWGGNYH